LARELGVESFGIFGSALSLLNIFGIFIGFGVAQLWLKVFGKEGWDGARWIRPSINFITLTIFITLAALGLWAYLGPHDDFMKNTLLIMSLFIVGRAFVELVGSKMQLEENYLALAIFQLLPNLLRLIVLAILIYIFAIKVNVTDVAWVYSFVSTLFIAAGVYQINLLKKGSFYLKGHGGKSVNGCIGFIKVRNVFSAAWPFGMASLFAFIYVQSDIIMVKYISGDIEAGYYSAAFFVLTAILIFPSVIYQKYLIPKYHRWANHNKKMLYNAYKKGNLYMALSGFVTMLFLLSISDFSIPFIFGAKYQNSVVLINILAMIIPVYFISFSVSATLMTGENIRRKVKYMGLTAAINIVLNYYLIGSLGARGAAFSTLLSYIILLLLYFSASQRYVFSRKY
jgi:O-antigen/teichoic acid export membrane protein